MDKPRETTSNATLVANGAFTISAVQADDDTAGMEADFEQANLALLAALRKDEDLEIDCHKAEGKLSQADHGKNGADKAISDFELALFGLVNKKRTDARYQRYFKGGLMSITRANQRTVQPLKMAVLLKKMSDDHAAQETDAELKALLVVHLPRVQAGAAKVNSAIAALAAVEAQREEMHNVMLPALRSAWTAKREVLFANLLAKFPHDAPRAKGYIKPLSKPKKNKKAASAGGAPVPTPA